MHPCVRVHRPEIVRLVSDELTRKGIFASEKQRKRNTMKTAGILILVVGLVMTLYTGFTYVTREKVVDIGPVQITRDKDHSVDWQPFVGIGVMIVGGAILVFGKKRPLVA
jgi:predicted nucleic acid-binding Zn ribbon protein